MTVLRVQCNVRIAAWEEGELRAERKVHNVFLDTGREWLIRQMSYDLSSWSWPGYAGVPGAGGDPEPYSNLSTCAQRRNLSTLSDASVRGVTVPGGSPSETLARIIYTGVGIGGNQQSGPIPEDVATAYPGTNIQTDVDPYGVVGLERPVRVRTDGATRVRWLQGLSSQTFSTSAPSTRDVICTYRATFSTSDINDAFLSGGTQYAHVPLSEAALYLWNANIDQETIEYSTGPLDYVMGVGASTPRGCVAYATFPTIDKSPTTAVTVDWEIRLI